jgi:hypothetical protein
MHVHAFPQAWFHLLWKQMPLSPGIEQEYYAAFLFLRSIIKPTEAAAKFSLQMIQLKIGNSFCVFIFSQAPSELYPESSDNPGPICLWHCGLLKR